MPAQGADHIRYTTDPVLVAGALVERHGGGLRAVDLANGATWWSLSRPGRVRVDSIGQVDARHAAIVWSDGRLTVVDVPTGHRVHVDLPDRSAPNTGKAEPPDPADPTVGLSGPSGRPLVAVVQPHGVDSYDASSGRHVWSRPAPADCVFETPVDAQQAAGSFLSLNLDCAASGAGLVVVSDLDAGQLRVYRAADGKQLWRYTFHSTGDDVVEMRTGMVIAGQVRVITGVAASTEVTTFDPAGKVEGSRDLPMFGSGGDARLVGGGYATLVVEDVNTLLDHYPDPAYALLTSAA